ncbi:hypothetical protein BROUX41_001390 [Berkeleyomyces rouxiae]|uniref:uncharacterized protein n=1 Tax=Berkeleyomyces rouxiae TaxID=2035830 RepID=UPI003B81ED79
MTEIVLPSTEEIGHVGSSSSRTHIETPTQSETLPPPQDRQTPRLKAHYTDPFEYYDGLLGFGNDANWNLKAEFPDIKGKGKAKVAARPAAAILAELTEDLDRSRQWILIEPPTALYQVSDNCPAAVAEIAIIANKNIAARAAEEKEKDEAEEAERSRAEEAAATEAAALTEARKIEGTESHYLPILTPEQINEFTKAQAAHEQTRSHGTTQQKTGNVESPPNSSSEDLGQAGKNIALNLPGSKTQQKTRRRAFAQLVAHATSSSFWSDATDGESSAAGTAKGLLRTLYKRKHSAGTPDSQSGSKLQNADEQIWDRMREVQKQREQERLEKAELQKSESIRKKETQKENATAAEVECVSCLDDFNPRVTVRVTCHNYCFQCFERLIQACTTNEAQWPPKCCLNPIDPSLIRRFCSAKLRGTVQKRNEEWGVPVSERFYCSQPACGLFIPPRSVDLAERSATCRASHHTCTLCRGPLHSGTDCPADSDLARMTELADEQGWKRCIDCGVMVEHSEACQHMTCRCGAQFCYVCGTRWRSCRCSMDDLSRVKRDAAARMRDRRQHEAREAREAEELREALAQIEEFEREEARKAELLRQEHARLEKERRRLEYVRRKSTELARQNLVEETFAMYSVAMEALGQMQAVQLAADHDRERRKLKEEATAAQKEMESLNVADMSAVEAESAVKLADLGAQLDAEMEERMAHAQRLADTYLESLETFYQGHTNAGALVDSTMREYQAKHEVGYRQWKAWRVREEETLQFKLEENKALREEANYVRQRRLEDSFGQKAAELEGVEMAAQQWMELVMAERQRLLRARKHMEKYDMGDQLEDFEEDERIEGPEIELLVQEREMSDKVEGGDNWWTLERLLEAFYK